MSDLNVPKFIRTMEAVGIKTVVIDENTEFVEPEPTVSPFIPDTNIQYAWDSTSLEYLKRCPRLYQYKMIEGWQSGEDNINLRFGGEYHKALHDYEVLKADGIDHDEALFLSVKELLLRTNDFRPESKYKTRESLVRTVVWYLEKFKDDTAKTVILSDGKPMVEFNFMFELDFGPTDEQPYVICGYLDRAVEFNGEVFVMDHKTTTTTPGQYYFNQFSPHNQMTLYTLAGKVVLNTPIKGVMISAAQILVGDSRFVRGITYRTQQNIEEWVDELRFWLAQAKSFADNGYWPMNDTACDKYGGCRFREVCSKSPAIREKYLQSEFVKGEQWNPLKPR